MKKKVLDEISKPLLHELFSIMKKKHLSVSATARFIGCNRRELQRWRSGKNFPKSLPRVLTLARIIEQLKTKSPKIEIRLEWGKNKHKLTKTFIVKEHRRVMQKFGIK